jgi:hypothetical protein
LLFSDADRHCPEDVVVSLWNDQLRLGVCPDRLVVAAYRRGLRPRLHRAEVVPLTAAAGAPRWRAAVDALPAALAPLVRDRPHVTVILSNHLVRYDLLPWNPALASERDWLAHARARLASVYGAQAGAWALCISVPAPRGERVVSATDEALVDAIEARVAAAGARLSGIQPHLIAVYSRIHPPPGERSFWLVVREPGRATVVLVRGGRWQAIRSFALEETGAAALADLIEGESAALGLDRPPLRVVVHSTEAFDASRFGRYEVRDVTLGAGSTLRDRNLAMAAG